MKMYTIDYLALGDEYTYVVCDTNRRNAEKRCRDMLKPIKIKIVAIERDELSSHDSED